MGRRAGGWGLGVGGGAVLNTIGDILFVCKKCIPRICVMRVHLNYNIVLRTSTHAHCKLDIL